MASIQTRSSVLALVTESTEGTPVVPTLATQFVALQDDFSMEPSFDTLENAELKASIGTAKPIQGAENPSASLSHYLRASGVVATAPNFGPLLKACLGAEAVASTEYNTVASSTVSVIKVDTGEGATFQRGEPLLIKDGVNGYRIRCIDSISGDDLTIGFQLPTGMAPGTGVNLGRAVLYYPINTGHPTLSVWHYVGNGGALQVMAGARVTSASFDISAGELINGSYDLEGVSFYFDPINITSADRYLDFEDDNGVAAAVVAAKLYNNPHDLAAAIQTAMRAVSAATAVVTYQDADGKFKITTSGTLLELLWNTGANTANTIGDKIGFSVAADDTGSAACTGDMRDNAVSFAAPVSPTYDVADPLAAKDNEVMLGDTADYVCFKASSVSFNISTPKSDILSVCAASGKDGSIINSREVTVSITALLEQYDAGEWNKFKTNANVKFQYSFGEKSGGNWVAGKCGALYIPTAVITSFNVEDQDGLAALSLELSGYVNSNGEGEAFVGFV